MTAKIKLSKKQTKAFDLLEDNKLLTEILYGGAAGGGKSFFGCFWQLFRRYQYPGTRGMIGRSKLKNLKQTTLTTFFDVAGTYFPFFEFDYKQQAGEIHFENGSEIVLKDLFLYPSDPDFASLGSLEITDLFIDEATEITEKAFSIAQSRIRYKLDQVGGIPKSLLTANPAHNWLKFRFVMDERNQPIRLQPYQKYIPAKVDDNPDVEFKRLYKSQLEKLPTYDRKRLLGGDWAVIENEKPFFYEYSNEKHISPIHNRIDPEWPVWISFDFNINPTTAIVSQKIPGKGLYIIAVHQVKGGTKVLCDELQQYTDYLLNVTGDHSGHSGSSAAGVLAGGQYNTDYAIIMQELNLSTRNLIDTRTPNKMHVHSRRLCNTVLFRLPLFINPTGCEPLINDLQTAQPTSAGKLMKDRDNHKQDVGDAFRYQVNAWFLNGMRDINHFANTLI
jgi:hypothetical protein